MTKQIYQKVVLVVLLILPFLLYFFWVYAQEDTFFTTLDYVGPKTTKIIEVDGKSAEDTVYYTIPDFELRSQNDTLISSNELRDNILLVNFFFSTCPSVCPAMNYKVQQIQNRFKGYEYFQIISITVDPTHDSVPVLKAYEKRIGAIDGRWHFLTGDQEDIYELAKGFFTNAMEDSLADGGYLHSENLLLVDWDGHLRSGRDVDGNIKAVYDGLSDDDMKFMKEDIKVLIAEFEKKKSVDKNNKNKAAKAKLEASGK